MKRKIHKKDLLAVQKMYDGVISFCTQSFFHTCNIDLSECPIWVVSDPRNNHKSYTVYAFCSLDGGGLPVVPLTDDKIIMLRLYNITLDAFRFLDGNGNMKTFLGIPAIGKNKERHIWIKVTAAEE